MTICRVDGGRGDGVPGAAKTQGGKGSTAGAGDEGRILRCAQNDAVYFFAPAKKAVFLFMTICRVDGGRGDGVSKTQGGERQHRRGKGRRDGVPGIPKTRGDGAAP
jgi:hypothetical protein